MNWDQDQVVRKPYAEKAMAEPMQQMRGQALGDLRRSSLREEAEEQGRQHLDQAEKKARAATFFREHPEFDEFIQLIRSGVIGI